MIQNASLMYDKRSKRFVERTDAINSSTFLIICFPKVVVVVHIVYRNITLKKEFLQ